MTTDITDYKQFLETKQLGAKPVGFDVAIEDLNPMLFDWQRDIVKWAIRKGRAALFEDCGLGKTIQQLEWAWRIHQHTQGNVLILAPLAVSAQTQREGEKFGIPATVCRTANDVQDGINVTNYERLDHFTDHEWAGLVLDESSILKAFTGIIRKKITDYAQAIPYRLACTATPAPNDLIELLNHAEFLDVMRGKEMIALFFTQDGNTTHKWRLKGHARDDFWRWMSTWSIAIRKPSDLGYQDNGFILPAMNVHQIVVDGNAIDGYLFPVKALGLDEQRKARRASLTDRVAAVADLINNSDEPWIAWCDLNAESEALTKAIPDATEIRGSHPPDYKEQALLDFTDGKCRVLVTKPSIAGFGMNWQHCARAAYTGLSNSFEQFYQSSRRIWRFGQTRDVEIYVVISENEGGVAENIRRKEKQAAMMFDNIVRHMSVTSEVHAMSTKRQTMHYETDVAKGRDWTLYLGDSIETIAQLEDESVGFTIFSPPFPGMYAYTNSPRDIGNVTDIRQLVEHFDYLTPELLRVTMPGRLCAIHLTQEPVFQSRSGYVGRRDFRGDVIRTMEQHGWIYWSEVTIDKNPQAKAARTKEHTLLFKTLSQDSSKSAPCLADYLVIFKKHGENLTPIPSGTHKRWNPNAGWITPEEWIEWAAPVWYSAQRGIPGGISETDVLNVKQARETDDERHLCPLQLGVIERAIKLWSAPGDLVYDPFAGVGSTGVKALEFRRQFVGGELKRSYWESAIRNLRDAEKLNINLFAWAQAQVQEV